jgi:iron complex transport system ATP-binding protein
VALELTVTGLSFAYRDTQVLRAVTLPPVRSGQVTALIGPNGAGKSTLLRCIAGLHPITAGRVRLGPVGNGQPPTTASGERTDAGPPGPGQVFYLPQETPPASSLTVFEAVLLARSQGGHRRGAARRDAEHDTGHALAGLDLDTLATRPISQLSGGQRQLVGLAQAVVRRPSVLLLDEPTSNLDLRNQLHILTLVRQLAADQSTAVLTTVHDLNLTARFADQVVALNQGAVHAAGPPGEVITPALLHEVYRVDGQVHHTQDEHLTVTAHRSLSPADVVDLPPP